MGKSLVDCGRLSLGFDFLTLKHRQTKVWVCLNGRLVWFIDVTLPGANSWAQQTTSWKGCRREGKWGRILSSQAGM